MKNEEKSTIDWKEMNLALDSGDWEYAIKLGDRFLSLHLDPSSASEARERFHCMSKMAQASYGLRKFDESLERYDNARQVAESYVDVCSDECLLVLFQMEKTLNALAVSGVVAETSAELKNALVSQYLMQSETSRPPAKERPWKACASKRSGRSTWKNKSGRRPP